MQFLCLNSKKRGAALIASLAFAAIISLVVVGVAKLTTGHYIRAKVEGDYATAILLADAGINYEIRWISDDTSDPNRPHQLFPAAGQPGPYTGTVPDVPGSFTVYVTKEDGSGPWYPPNDVIVTSTGTVYGVSRTVQIRGVRKSLFDEFALYGTNSIKINGDNSLINGNIGTNGGMTFTGSGGTGQINGDLFLNGTGTNVNRTGSNVFSTTQPVPFPTVQEVANSLFPGGLTWLKTNNNNDNLRQFSPDRVLDPNFEIANSIPAGLAKSTWTINSQTFNGGGGLTIDNNVADKPISQGGTRYCTQNEGLYGETQRVQVNGKPGAIVYVMPQVSMQGEPIASRAVQDNLLRDTIVYLTCVHELGHAVGLQHTRKFEDIMYFFGFGGNIVDYFMRYRSKLQSRSDIVKYSGLSASDVEVLRNLYR